MFKWVSPIYTQFVGCTMKNQISDPHGLKSLGLQDDLLILSRIYSLTQLMYVDISKQEIIKEIIQRWKILKEFSEIGSKK